MKRKSVLKVLGLFLSSLLFIQCQTTTYKKKSEVVWPEDNLKANLKIKPSVKSPFSVGIYYVNDEYWSKILANSKAGELQEFDKEIVSTGAVSYINIINKAHQNTVEAIRAAGARQDVDAVLILEDSTTFEYRLNFLSPLYLTIVGLWFVPGHSSEALITMKASLWDVKTGYLILTSRGEGEYNTWGSYQSLNNRELPARTIKGATKESLKSLLRHIKRETPKAIIKLSKYYKN
ncbi:MAG: hypothetical protein AAF518_08150 [Spirochaetota bacterium]